MTSTSPLGLLRELGDDRRQPELLEREDLERDRPERAGDRAALHEDVRAEAREALHAEREVELVRLLELDLLLLGEDRVAELLRVDGPERRELERNDLRRRCAGAAASRS